MVVWWIDGSLYVLPSPSNVILISTVMTGMVGLFIPFSKTMDLIYAVGGTLLFSGYIVYDTYMINAKLSPDEFIMGAISLYLEYVLQFYRLDYICLLTFSYSSASSISVTFVILVTLKS